MQLFVSLNGQKYGPYTRETIANFVKEGRVNGETPCWYEGLPQWVPLKTVFPDLFAQTPPVPPSQPAQPQPANYPPPPPYQQPSQQKSGKGCCMGCLIVLVIFLVLTGIAGFFMWKYGKAYIKEYKMKYQYQFNSSMYIENKISEKFFDIEKG